MLADGFGRRNRSIRETGSVHWGPGKQPGSILDVRIWEDLEAACFPLRTLAESRVLAHASLWHGSRFSCRDG